MVGTFVQPGMEFYKMCLGVCPAHTLGLIGLAQRYNLEGPILRLHPCPTRIRKMLVAFMNYTSLHGFSYHWEVGESSFTCSISFPLLHSFCFTFLLDYNPSFCFRSDYEGKTLLEEFLCSSCWT